MSRKRLSWIYKTADPFTMNQDHSQPGHDDYVIGDPSAFAEDVHRDLPDDEALGRNEIGQPNMSEWNLNHKDVDEWNSGDAYDNGDTFAGGDKKRQSSMQRDAARDVYARLEKKAFQCVKIASAILPGAPEALVEEQAFDLMALPDEAVIATVLRLAADDEDEEDGDDEKEASDVFAEDSDDDEDDDDSKDASEDEDDEDEAKDASDDEDEDDEGADKEASFGDLDDDRIEAMLREMIAEDDEDEDDEDEDEEDDDDDSKDASDDEDVDEDDEKESMHMDDMDALGGDDMMEEDPEVDAMIRDMMDHQQEPVMESSQDDIDLNFDGPVANDNSFDVEMEPTMDVVGTNIDENDDVLRSLFADTVPEEAREKSSAPQTRQASQKRQQSRGVQTLGGRVKEAANGEGDVDLSKLWASDPDVSDIF